MQQKNNKPQSHHDTASTLLSNRQDLSQSAVEICENVPTRCDPTVGIPSSADLSARCRWYVAQRIVPHTEPHQPQLDRKSECWLHLTNANGSNHSRTGLCSMLHGSVTVTVFQRQDDDFVNTALWAPVV